MPKSSRRKRRQEKRTSALDKVNVKENKVLTKDRTTSVPQKSGISQAERGPFPKAPLC